MTLDEEGYIHEGYDIIDENAGHRIHEMAQMNSPDDELGDVDIWVFGDSAINGIIKPHFHVCGDKNGDGHHYAIDIAEKIRNIEKLTILHSNTGHIT